MGSKSEMPPERPEGETYHGLDEGLKTAMAHQRAGALEKAEAVCRHLIGQHPKAAEAHHNLSVILKGVGRLADAETHANAAIALEPKQAAPYNNLGLVLSRQRKFEAARGAFETAIKLAPKGVAAHKNLGILLADHKFFNEAVEHFRSALSSKPDVADIHGLLGKTLLRVGQVEAAEQSLRQALKLDPKHSEVWISLGGLLSQTGQKDEAAEAYAQALSEKTDHPRAIYQYAVHRWNITGEAAAPVTIQAIETFLKIPGRSIADRCYLHCAAGELLAQAGRFDAALAQFKTANDLRRNDLGKQGKAFNFEAHQTSIQAIIDNVTAESFGKDAFGFAGSSLVFMVGMPQGGERIIASALARHPDVEVVSENLSLGRLAKTLGYPKGFDGLDPERVKGLAGAYIKRIETAYPNARRVLDPTASNFLRLGLVGLMFPKALVVSVRRNAMDCCLWSYMRNIGMPWPFSHSLSELGRFHLEYERLMAYWELTLPLKIKTVRFEGLAAEPELTIRGLLRTMGLTWHKECTLGFHALTEIRRSIGRWEAYQDHLGSLMMALSGEPGEDADIVVKNVPEPEGKSEDKPGWSLAHVAGAGGARDSLRPDGSNILFQLPPVVKIRKGTEAALGPEAAGAGWSLGGLAGAHEVLVENGEPEPAERPLFEPAFMGSEEEVLRSGLGKILGHV